MSSRKVSEQHACAENDKSRLDVVLGAHGFLEPQGHANRVAHEQPYDQRKDHVFESPCGNGGVACKDLRKPRERVDDWKSQRETRERSVHEEDTNPREKADSGPR